MQQPNQTMEMPQQLPNNMALPNMLLAGGGKIGDMYGGNVRPIMRGAV